MPLPSCACPSSPASECPLHSGRMGGGSGGGGYIEGYTYECLYIDKGCLRKHYAHMYVRNVHYARTYVRMYVCTDVHIQKISRETEIVTSNAATIMHIRIHVRMYKIHTHVPTYTHTHTCARARTRTYVRTVICTIQQTLHTVCIEFNLHFIHNC